MEAIPVKQYAVGMYGGKFMPFHKGHFYCIEKALMQCEKVYVILFYGGADEEKILAQEKNDYLTVENRIKQIQFAMKEYFSQENVEFKLIDVSLCRDKNGEEDWDAETPLVLNAIGKMDAVYSSEPSYEAYFQRAYPWAKHILVDPPREVYPISGTKIRSMKDINEQKKWMV